MKDKLKMAEINYEKAVVSWKKRHIDDEYVDDACIDLMFSIETAIKHLIEYSGVKAPHTHSVKDLLAALPTEYYGSDWYEILEKWKRVTDSWYNESRYSSSFSATATIVEDYIVACKRLIADAKANVRYDCTTELRVRKVLNKLNSTRTVSEVLKFLPSCELTDDMLFSLVTDILSDKLSYSKPASDIASAVSKMTGDDK